jgi:hypothetical protein
MVLRNCVDLFVLGSLLLSISKTNILYSHQRDKSYNFGEQRIRKK